MLILIASVRGGGAGTPLLMCGWAVSFRISFALVPTQSMYCTIGSFWILITCAPTLRYSCPALGSFGTTFLGINKVDQIISVQLMQVLNSRLLRLILLLLSTRALISLASTTLDCGCISSRLSIL